MLILPLIMPVDFVILVSSENNSSEKQLWLKIFLWKKSAAINFSMEEVKYFIWTYMFH